jgi:hypothetical protein
MRAVGLIAFGAAWSLPAHTIDLVELPNDGGIQIFTDGSLLNFFPGAESAIVGANYWKRLAPGFPIRQSCRHAHHDELLACINARASPDQCCNHRSSSPPERARSAPVPGSASVL